MADNSAFEYLSASIQRNTSIPDRVAELLREMILSGKWRPGDRIVETKVAKHLNIGQPTVREALGRLEEAGLVTRHPNSGCVVTQLSKVELGQLFRVRIELEKLAVELAIDSDESQKAQKLKSALARLQKAGRKSNVAEYYRADFEFHKTIWQLAENRFLLKALSQLIVPLINFAMLEIATSKSLDFVRDASEHDQIVEAILGGDKKHARSAIQEAMERFWDRGLALAHEDIGGSDPGPSPHKRRKASTAK